MTKHAPHGYWPSPITGELVAGKTRRFGHLTCADEHVYWCEGRPEEEGRCVIVRAPVDAPDKHEDILPAPWSASARVHEYGGGEFSVTNGRTWFVNADDQDVYLVSLGGVSRITRSPDMRFTDLVPVPDSGRVFAVAEQEIEGAHHPQNMIVEIDVPSGKVTPVVQGADFYAQLRLSPDARHLAFIAWDLPGMPWDNAALFTAAVDADGLAPPIRLTTQHDGTIFQPEWEDDTTLRYVSDVDGFGRLYRHHVSKPGPPTNPLTPAHEDLLRPLWNFSMRSHARANDALWTSGFKAGESVIRRDGTAVLDELVEFSDPAPAANRVAGYAAFSDRPTELIIAGSDGTRHTIRTAADIDLDTAYFSPAEVVQFPGADGAEVAALYYPPANAAVTGAPGIAPPAIVTAHGGPTGMAKRGLILKTQYWTSRGFAVLDVDYSGSSGYGRAYRDRLDAQWGVRDVADVVAAAHWLAQSGRADGDRLAISGGSAGGYTVLMALATSTVFNAGACHYGIGDLAQLLKFTHKFEAGYLYRLFGVGPDNWQETFAARSPINLLDGFRTPTIFFQGAEDAVVPPEQSRTMVKALEENNIPVAYHEFEGERHGFRKAETITTVLEKELEFFRTHLKLGEPEAAASTPS
ncbi:MAG: prolyl oligopeptidase family serine peptidase [Pseudomonadota bacterium]